ncbi:DNA-binding MarR family transcriptional regulator [Saccharopolyspora erythraea NRRL 2338]|uniref:HTH marR-type domain-containing protein n=1 Tax=Saccharopolyspora erythraea TaxID=1836 RepID=A0ABP3LR28_SACER|nr:MarR family transcriptional regulator [Saccharopolyspora erythraea]EQD84429.1 ArsR family transcriptional regulator [Saccharopolyspora erythraea D]PFG99017.1 DNA-binding MarR family transcriptional regulator [Saccharopolyspora erythraea NRRL 2338]QRK88986.1 MarR family transcriptional regulator [Saccharopolyspora erythraea]
MDTAADLGRLLGPLRRALLRSTRATEDLPDLPEAQIEVLRVLAAEGPLGTSAVAERLRISPSTVSNLVRSMMAAGLVQRRRSESDLRAVGLSATAEALDLLERYDRASREILRTAMDRLSAADRARLADAVPALENLVSNLSR